MNSVLTTEEQSFISAWELSKVAASMQEALRLEWEREDYIQSLYDDIRYFGYRYCDPTDPPGSSPSVEGQALEILDAKNAYELRIIKLREKYSRWRAFLQMLDRQAADVLESHFEKGSAVSDAALTRVVKRAVRAWEGMEYARGKAMDEQAKEEYGLFRQQYPELFKRRPHTYPYLIDGVIQQMSPFDYEMLQRDERFYSTGPGFRKSKGKSISS